MSAVIDLILSYPALRLDVAQIIVSYHITPDVATELAQANDSKTIEIGLRYKWPFDITDMVVQAVASKAFETAKLLYAASSVDRETIAKQGGLLETACSNGDAKTALWLCDIAQPSEAEMLKTQAISRAVWQGQNVELALHLRHRTNSSDPDTDWFFNNYDKAKDARLEELQLICEELKVNDARSCAYWGVLDWCFRNNAEQLTRWAAETYYIPERKLWSSFDHYESSVIDAAIFCCRNKNEKLLEFLIDTFELTEEIKKKIREWCAHNEIVRSSEKLRIALNIP
jgi:hypothetical protein